jgi:predicted nucleotidyltransferase
MPTDWTDRAKAPTFQISKGYTVTCPSEEDLALAKLCAWRDKDKVWLKECSRLGIIDTGKMKELGKRIDPLKAPPIDEIMRRIEFISHPTKR